MTESKMGRPRTATGKDGRHTIAVYKGSGEYAEWLRQVAKQDRIGVTAVIDQAVAEWAAKRGYKVPPERLGGIIDE